MDLVFELYKASLYIYSQISPRRTILFELEDKDRIRSECSPHSYLMILSSQLKPIQKTMCIIVMKLLHASSVVSKARKGNVLAPFQENKQST